MRRRLIVGMAALATVGLLAAAPAVAHREHATASRMLLSGHALRAGTGHDTLASPNGRFALTVESKIVTLSESVPVGPANRLMGASVWFEADVAGKDIGGNDQTALRLRTSGDLVLRTSKGHTLWATHTSGHDTRLIVTNTGNLRLKDRAGHLLWSSHTTSVVRAPGEQIRPGQQLVRRPSYWQKPHWSNRLRMRRDGDLVLTCGPILGWSTHTSVPGSHAVMRANGKLAVVSPSGKTLWSSPHASPTPNVILRLVDLSIDTLRGHTVWFAQTDDRC